MAETERTTVIIPLGLRNAAKAAGINITEVARKALETALDDLRPTTVLPRPVAVPAESPDHRPSFYGQVKNVHFLENGATEVEIWQVVTRTADGDETTSNTVCINVPRAWVWGNEVLPGQRVKVEVSLLR